MDDREDFVTQERFPQVDERITGDFETLSEKIPPYENAWYVVVTRGHLGDSACARQILKRPFAYFGMIGSKTKVRIHGRTGEQHPCPYWPSYWGTDAGGDRGKYHGRNRAGKKQTFSYIL